MSDLRVILIFLAAIIVSSVCIRILPKKIPSPLIQISIGYAIAMAGGSGVKLDPNLFMFLFLPPLLFWDAWQIQKLGFFQNIRSILSLAMGLVVFTVFGLGYLLHWLIPVIPLPAAFALAAILSPTDPVAITAMTRNVPLPKRLMQILEGESLLNDASGLVCMRFAIAAIATSSFSLEYAVFEFSWLVVAGVAIGLSLSYVANYLEYFVNKRLSEDSSSQILFSLLIPFTVYFLAEKVGGSGVLAVVAAGIVMSRWELSHLSKPTTQLRRRSVWKLIQFTLNTAMFILLGEQLPAIFKQASQLVEMTGHINSDWLIIYSLLVVVALIVIRFIWVGTVLLIGRKRQPMRILVLTALSGVRGSITLAGVLSIPLVLSNGDEFPARDLIIFIAATVIILSLLVASVSLPLVLKGLQLNSRKEAAEQEWQVREKATAAALKAIHSLKEKFNIAGLSDCDEIVNSIAVIYKNRLNNARYLNASQTELEQASINLKIEREIWLTTILAERRVIQHEVRNKRLTDDVARALLHELDLLEQRWIS